MRKEFLCISSSEKWEVTLSLLTKLNTLCVGTLLEKWRSWRVILYICVNTVT